MRPLAQVLLLVLLGGTASARDDKDKEWTKLEPKGGNFSVAMPGKPKEQMPRDIEYTGGKSKLHMFILETDGGKAAYMAAYNDFPAESITDEVAQEALDGAQKGAVTNVKGKLLATKKITLQKKHPGRDFSFEVPGVGQARARVYMSSDGRLYQAAVFGSEEFIKSKDAEKFLDSFKVFDKN